MEESMTKSVGAAFVLLMFIALTPALAHDGHTHRIMGTITTVDGQHLEVKTPSGEVLSIQINDKTQVTRAKKKSGLDQVKKGGRVVVDIGNGEDPLIAREIQVGETKIVEEGDKP
jgi:hypothetical protein